MAHLVVGLILAALGVWGIVSWWNMFGLVMRGVVPFCLLVFGLIALLAACRRAASGVFAGHGELDVELGDDAADYIPDAAEDGLE